MRFSFAAVAAVVGLALGDVAAAQYLNSTTVITVTACVPTTYLSTSTITPTTTVPVGTVGTASSTVVGSTTSSISPSITPYTGAASNIGGSIAAAGIAAIAAIVLA